MLITTVLIASIHHSKTEHAQDDGCAEVALDNFLFLFYSFVWLAPTTFGSQADIKVVTEPLILRCGWVGYKNAPTQEMIH